MFTGAARESAPRDKVDSIASAIKRILRAALKSRLWEIPGGGRVIPRGAVAVPKSWGCKELREKKTMSVKFMYQSGFVGLT